MPTARSQPIMSTADRERYLWLLSQVTFAPISSDGHCIFDVRLALPPAKTVEASIDLARRPFEAGQALTPCWAPISRKRSKMVVTPCEPVQLKGYENFRFGVHLEPGHRFRWHVTEFSTGASVTSHCPSREAALAKLQDRVGKYRPKYFQNQLDWYRNEAYNRAQRPHP